MSPTASIITASPEEPLQESSRLQILHKPADRGWTAIALLLAWCGSLFFYGLTAGELYRTESLRAIVAEGFLRSGNWIVPTLYGEPIFTKPPGMHAAIALFSWPFGAVTEWTARLPSAVAASIAVFLFYGYFTRQLGRLGGLVAAAILPASFMWLDKGSAAEIDMMQVTWVTAAIVCFLRALEIEQKRQRIEDRGSSTEDRAPRIDSWRVKTADDGRTFIAYASSIPPSSILYPPSSILYPRCSLWFWWLAALLCVAGGVLTKWTAPAFFYGTVVPLLWWRGQLRLLLGRHHLVSAAVCAILCLTWIGTAVSLTTWHAFYSTVSREAFMRLLPNRHYRPYPWLETLAHPLKVLIANLPWSAFALLTLRPGFARLWDEPGRRLLQALHCWTWPNFIFWTIIPEHAPRHSFPLYPGIAGLAALVWLAWLTGRLQWSIPSSSVHSTRSRIRPTTSLSSAAGRWARDMGVRFAARPAWVLIAMLAFWLIVKIVFVEVVIPGRNYSREPRAKGERLAALIPADRTLYLSRLKDEGIMFYYHRTVRRLASFEELPSSERPLYCILDDSEWRQWSQSGTAVAVEHMRDEQGDPIVLVRVTDIPPKQEIEN
jgi:4-amino-4-deoxy-L-arabinose transferase-like glycosyltransferase